MDIQLAPAKFLELLAELYQEAVFGAFTFLAGSIPDIAAYLQLLPEVCSVVLATIVLLLSRRLRRTRAALRGLAAEVQDLRQGRSAPGVLRGHSDANIGRILGELADLQRRQRSLESRLGKPDPQLAAALTRAGTQPQHMVDCGLSHSEVHLLRALNCAGNSGEVAAA